jgi:hypothetical protein
MLAAGCIGAAGCSGGDDSPSRAPDDVRNSTSRLAIRGSATLDGAPFDAQFLGAVVRQGRLVTPCQADIPPVSGGRYEITVLPWTEGRGCGVRGAQVLLWTFVQGRKLYTTSAVTWPRRGKVANFDAKFSTAAPNGDAPALSEFSGEVFDRDRRRLPPGTNIEAYIGSTRCGVASVRRAGTDFTGYVLTVVGQDSIPGCTRGAPITFRIDGRPARETYVNQLNGGARGSGAAFPLTQS